MKLLFTILIVAILALVLVAPTVDLPFSVAQDISGAILLLIGVQLVARLYGSFSAISHLTCHLANPFLPHHSGRSASLLFGEIRC